MKFQAIYNNWESLKKYARGFGIKCTTLKSSETFRYKMLERVVNKNKLNEHKGYGWCGNRCRWGTTYKVRALDKHCENLNANCYIGDCC